MTKQVYIAMSVDVLDPGHLRTIEVARELGEVTIGLLTDEAIASYKKVPILTFEQRKRMFENIKGVKKIVTQKTLDYVENLKLLKPDFVVHRDEYKTEAQRRARERIIEILKEWGGQLIEPKYIQAITPEEIKNSLKEIASSQRLKRLKRLLNTKGFVRILEAHNGLTGLIVENTKIKQEDGTTRDFDGMWISSLTDSTVKGKPDIGIVDFTSRLNTIDQILESTTKPIILDGDSGGLTEHFVFMVRTLERLGVSAVIIEDKIGLKKNSLFGDEVQQRQDSLEDFSHKISQGKKAQRTNDFMIIARVESLILKKGMEDALERAKAYIDAGADAIMIHSKEKDGQEILDFCRYYSEFDRRIPLVVVPSTYSHLTENQLKESGVNIVIYANHLLRSAYPAMKKTAELILENCRCHEANEFCMPIKEILTLIPGGD